ncbi:MAG TPA: hypothetical protein VNO43_18385 [Candidatus Eisenbacteria bacterium]|nr:hypothetical protein [Candidatus Eisenbacteria bacterium]
MLLAFKKAMKFICQHCDELTTGTPYRVVSEENGVVLLDMIVCYACYLQAKELGLRTEAIKVPTSRRLRAVY